MTSGATIPKIETATAPAATDNRASGDAQSSAAALIPEPRCFAKERSGDFNGATLAYRAVASETYIRDHKAAPAASFFSIAYLKSDVEEPAIRPVTFIFNGGPGSSAQWLHMGVFGPTRIVVPSDPEHVGAPPYTTVHNSLSLLDSSDLVFIDPIGTGYSRALGTQEPKHYWGLMEDARSIADFIQTWVTDNQRWNSPKFLAGESYGTVRASLLAEILSTRYIALNGLVLIAGVLDYQNSRPRAGDGGILAYASFIPTYAAVAWYHGKVSRSGRTLESFLNDARTFARTDYAEALIANWHRLSTQERARLVSCVAGYTGLKERYVEQSKLRIPVDRFFKEILREEGLTIGRLDGRYTGVEPDSVGEMPESDPTFDAVGGAFTSALQVLLSELGVRMERPYLPMTNIVDSWNWLLQEKAPNGGGYINAVPHLGRAMRHSKDLRVLAASAYFDLATPFFGMENALSQDGLVQERITHTYYEAGHMIFLHEPSRVRLLCDVRRFIQGQSETRSDNMRE